MLGVGRWGPLGRAEAEGGGGRPPIAATRTVSAAPGLDEREAWVVLNSVDGLGPVSFARLVNAFGSALAVLRTARDSGAAAAFAAATMAPDGGAASMSPAAARALVEASARLELILEPITRCGLTVLTLADEAYPFRLRQIDLPPPVLYLHGEPAVLDRPLAVAIVGTRRPTAIGRTTAGRIADGVASLGATVISGLALGIDGAAHAAAVRRGLPTVAVLGGGHARLYPAAHRGLARGIVDGGGAVLSEFPPDMQPGRGTFPRRNRIISGLADATVVVEAGARSGALTTAAWALEQGRSLHIVPGRLDDPAVAGCLAFLREAGPEARIVAGVPELLEDLASLHPTARQPTADVLIGHLASVEQEIARQVAEGCETVDELVLATGNRSATVLGALTTLELAGLVVEVYGRYRATGALAAHRSRPRVSVPKVRGSGGRRAA